MGLPVKRFRKRIEPRVAGTSRYEFFIGARMSAPSLSAWLPRNRDRVSRYSNWFVCWNLGRKSGEPMLVPPKYPSIEVRTTPPAKVGSWATPLIWAAVGGSCPKGSCSPSESPPLQEKRNSFTREELMIFVQPATRP